MPGLRRLELHNFKSYRGHVNIEFGVAPFTCIIGPNGSGKSNLMDAISFVLGVKSAQLRSTQLKDLVYRGRKAAEDVPELMGLDADAPESQNLSQNGNTDGRTASVAAIYEDAAGKIWTFKRTISTSGASTYYLQGKPVTYVIYNTQLEKFNILVKAKNFLVFQGDVEGVASQDAKALSKLIDRISGSLELAPQYEAAKLAQEKAAEAANANHAKKRSMLTEVKHFKDQKAEVDQWEQLRAAKDAMVQRHLMWKLYHLTQEINEAKEEVEKRSEQLNDLNGEVHERENELKEARKHQAETMIKVKKQEANVKKAERAVEEKQPDLVTLETQIAHSEKKGRNTQAIFEQVERDHKRQSEELETLEAGRAQINERMEEAKERQRQRNVKAGKALSADDLAEYRKLRSEANVTATTERQQLETLRREQKSLRDAIASIDDRLSQAERKRSKLKEELDTLSERESTMSDKVKSLEAEKKRIKAQIDNAQAERERISLQETEINDRLQEALNKLLQAGVDRRESEREAKMKETLASLRRVFPGVHGRVIDLCKPTAGKYDTAVQTMLGRNIDAVVVDQEKIAIDCIEYMRQQRFGQATFIPIDTIQVKAVPEKLRTIDRRARLAIDCLEFDPAVERAMQYVCGSALICDTTEVAKTVCYEKRQEVKCVTLDGTVFHKSGLITGGRGHATRKFSDRDVDGLKATKDKLVAKLHELNASKPKEKADEGLIQDLARLGAEGTEAKDDLQATQLRIKGLRKEISAVDQDIKMMTPEKKKRESALTTAEAQSAQLAAVVETEDDKIFGAFCQRIGVANIREYEDVQLKVAQEENEVLQSFVQQDRRISHQIEFQAAQVKATEERLAQLQSISSRELKNAERLRENKEELENEIEELQAEIEKQREKLEKYNAKHEKASAEVEEARDAARQAQRRLDKMLKEISSYNDGIARCGSDRHAIYRKCRLEDIDLPLESGSLSNVPIAIDDDSDAMDVDEDSLSPAKVNDYGIELDFTILEEDDKENSAEDHGQELETQINKMKVDIERVTPNMKAVSRLEEVENELRDAETEADEARQESKRAREEFLDLKKRRCNLFNKAFTHMSKCIDQIYKDLTKNSVVPQGGMAFLSLEDAEEPYLAGVKYNTMPPGKRFVEIEQLSGGEKTMAALALLFSIHSFHPAPFFVLDEVDAALDPTNVSKLARFVREQSEKGVQFIIISLKSTLYEHADGLVGVYREQVMNSSQTLSLDLAKYE